MLAIDNAVSSSTLGHRSSKLNMHFKHNSLVDFSFINEKQSTNARKY